LSKAKVQVAKWFEKKTKVEDDRFEDALDDELQAALYGSDNDGGEGEGDFDFEDVASDDEDLLPSKKLQAEMVRVASPTALWCSNGFVLGQ
jgi:hypothetical protein